MTEDINKKVIDIFSNHANKTLPLNNEKVKFYAGFNYVKIDKDNNGNKFNPEHLIKYAQNCHYIIRVMREYNGETILYNYDVPNEDLLKFMRHFENHTLDGTIIEIDKYFSEDPA